MPMSHPANSGGAEGALAPAAGTPPRSRAGRRLTVAAAVLGLFAGLVAFDDDPSTREIRTLPDPVSERVPSETRDGRAGDGRTSPVVPSDDAGEVAAGEVSGEPASPASGGDPSSRGRLTGGRGSARSGAARSPAGRWTAGSTSPADRPGRDHEAVAGAGPVPAGPSPAPTAPPAGRPGVPALPSGPRPPTPGEPTPPTVPEPALDQRNCPNLGLVAIGDAATDQPVAVAASARFRAMAAAELDAPHLVCARPIERWRDDVVVQRLVANGTDTGALVGGLRAQDPVVRFSRVEWTSFQFRDGGVGNRNFAGVPTGRIRLGGHEVIRTSIGGLVMERPDTLGNVVINGAWDVWMARGGPTGPMGIPTGEPTGILGIGAHQDFTNGYLLLPGVTTELEAEAQPASRYQWHPVAAADRLAAAPAPHSIVEVTGASYYVDRQGVRHWLATGSDWSCARHDLGAQPAVRRGWAAAARPLGDPFVCPG